MTRLTNDLHPLLTPDVLSALFNKSIYTNLNFVRKKPALLTTITGLQCDQILSIKDRILAKNSSPLKRGDKHYREIINRCAIICSGIKQFDVLLEGGFVTGNIYELCGFEASGKTQMCMTVALNICSTTPHQVLFIDTKYDISGRRLVQMLSARNVSNVSEVLEKIKIIHPTSAYKLLSDLHHLKAAFSELKGKYLGFKVIIIDSLPVLFQAFNNLTEGLSILNHIANVMKYLVSEFHLVILITNFVTIRTGETAVIENDDEFVNSSRVELPALGRYWAHVPNTRITIKKRGCLDECYLTILKSSCKPIGESVKVQITEAGVV